MRRALHDGHTPRPLHENAIGKSIAAHGTCSPRHRLRFWASSRRTHGTRARGSCPRYRRPSLHVGRI